MKGGIRERKHKANPATSSNRPCSKDNKGDNDQIR